MMADSFKEIKGDRLALLPTASLELGAAVLFPAGALSCLFCVPQIYCLYEQRECMRLISVVRYGFSVSSLSFLRLIAALS